MKVTKLNRLGAQPVGDRAHKCIIIVTIIDCPGELTDDQAAFLLLPVRQSTIDIRLRCVGGRGWEWYL